MVWMNDVPSLVLALVFGSAIGMEREISGKAAGLRTNVLICVGAAIFTIISREMGGQHTGSATRIAAGVVAGVGFLGAGAIIQDRGGVRGLTTAASIWLVSSIGMACGARFYSLAVVSTLIGILVLLGFGRLEKPLGRYGKKHKPKSFFDEQDKSS